MHEVLDLDASIAHPGGEDGELAAIAHAALAREFRDGVCAHLCVKVGLSD